MIFRIDDGPDKYTSELVKTMKELGIKHAIFGLIGRNVLQYPDAVQEIVDAYIVANHTFTHPRMHLRWVRAYIDSRDSIRGRKRLTLNQLVAQITHFQNKKDTVEVLIHSRKGGWSDKIREIDKVLTSLKGNNNKRKYFIILEICGSLGYNGEFSVGAKHLPHKR